MAFMPTCYSSRATPRKESSRERQAPPTPRLISCPRIAAVQTSPMLAIWLNSRAARSRDFAGPQAVARRRRGREDSMSLLVTAQQAEFQLCHDLATRRLR
jgi:hypothetical protein